MCSSLLGAEPSLSASPAPEHPFPSPFSPADVKRGSHPDADGRPLASLTLTLSLHVSGRQESAAAVRSSSPDPPPL